MATPAVGSLAALIMSYGKNKQETVEILNTTADAMPDSSKFAAGHMGA